MNTGQQNFQDLLSSALGSAEYLQSYLDDVIAKKYATPQLDGFVFANQILTNNQYTQVQKELKLNVMATYVDKDSEGKTRGTQGLELSTGKIPTMATRMEYDEEQMRNIMLLQQRFGAQSDAAMTAAKDTLFDTFDNMIGAHANSLTYQRHQMVSKAQVELTDTNNPNGIVGITFSANVPAANITNLTTTSRWWTDTARTTEGSASDPIKDLKALVRKSKLKGSTSVHFEIEALTLEDLLLHSKVKIALGYSLVPTAGSDAVATTIANNLDYDSQKAGLERIIKCPIVAIDSLVAVEKYNTAKMKLEQSEFSAFEENVVVLVPNGNLGEFLAVEQIKLPNSGLSYADYYGGRLLVKIGVDVMKTIQYFTTKMACLAVPNKPQLMFYLNVAVQ